MTTPPPYPPQPDQNMGGQPNSDDKTMALISHFGIVFFGWLPALIIYLIKGDSPWAKQEAAKAFNFAITATIGYVILFVISFVSAAVDLGFIGCFTGLGYFALWVTLVVFGVINGMKVNKGEETKYPFEIPILK